MPDPRLPRGAIARRKTGVLPNALCLRLAIVAAGCLCLAGHAEAHGRPPPARREAIAPRASGDVLAEALQFVGSPKFTRAPGPWCADAVSAWLAAAGRPPLPNRLAASALAYGPRVATPRPGDLVVLRTRRGSAGHVGIVVADLGGAIEIVSGNWSGRVARAIVPRATVTAFVRVG